MGYHNDLITIVNNAIKANSLCDAVFTNAAFWGIAYDDTENDSGSSRVYPVVQDLAGNGTKVNPDDTYALQIYHRILNKTYQVDKGSVGTRSNVVNEKTEVKMIVAGWTTKLSMTQEDLEILIASNFPDQIAAALYTPIKIRNMVVALQSSVLDKAQVWREEYKGIPYTVKPEQILFSMRYTIESTYKKGCFIINDCQPAGVLQ